MALACGAGDAAPAKGHLGGGGIGNGSGGGGGSGFFGGGSGASKIGYTGGGGGVGVSWVHASVTLLATEGGAGQTPGGKDAPGYQGDAGRGGEGVTSTTDTFLPGQPGLIVMNL